MNIFRRNDFKPSFTLQEIADLDLHVSLGGDSPIGTTEIILGVR